MEWLAPERYAAELTAEAGRLATAAARQRPEAIVPTCPEWTLRDLVTHVGTGHRYAAGVIGTGAPAPYRLIDAPSDQDAWTGWLIEGARSLNAAVRARGFTGETWTWQPKHQTAGFWLRRMVHDLVIHRVDADPAGTIAPDLAADGVSDLLLCLATLEALKGSGETLRFHAADLARSWHVTLTTSGISWTENDHAADVTLAAPVQQLLLILNRRLPSPAPSSSSPETPAELRGDVTLWERWRDASRF